MANLTELLAELDTLRRREEQRLFALRRELMEDDAWAGLEREIVEINLQRGRMALKGDKVYGVAGKIPSLRRLQHQRMVAMGYPPDSLTPRHRCPDCRDKGYRDSRLCGCVTSRLDSPDFHNLTLPDLPASFESFDESLFSDKIKVQGELSQRQIMVKIRDICLQYAEGFPCNERPNLLFTGRTGLGKSYLLACIARHVAERSDLPFQPKIAFLTAYEFVDRLMAQLRRGSIDMDPLLQAHLLILDDLGSEPDISNVTTERLFVLLNERNQARRPTLMATNLSPSELGQRYNERIASRIRDREMTAILPFLGADLRLGCRYPQS